MVSNLRGLGELITSWRVTSPVLRIVLGGPLLVAGTLKAVDPADFTSVLKFSFSFPHSVSILLAAVVPLIEIGAGLSLLLDQFVVMGLIGARVLALSFVVFHIWALSTFGVRESCHCFGGVIDFDTMTSFIIACVLASIGFLPRRVFITRAQEGMSLQGKRSFALLLSLVVALLTLGAGAMVRYRTLDSQLNSGLLASVNIPTVKHRVEQVFHDALGKKRGSRPYLVLVLKSPVCESCAAELRFWGKQNFDNQVDVVALFPKASAGADLDLQTDARTLEYQARFIGFRYDTQSIDVEVFRELIGEYPPPATRLLFSTAGELLCGGAGKTNDIEQLGFLRDLQEILNIRIAHR